VNANVSRPGLSTRPFLHNRHSYAGPGSASGRSGKKLPWTRGGVLRGSPGSESPSPRSCLSDGETHILDDDDDDEDMFFDGPKDSSFVFSVTEGTPSPRRNSVGGGAGLRKKYKPRDSGVVMSDDEGNSMNMGTGMGMYMRMGGTLGASGSIGGAGDYLSVMPSASNSVNSVSSDVDQLVTPGYGPGERSGWPEAFVVTDGDGNAGARGEEGVDVDVDAFILRTLADGTNSRRGSEGGGGPGVMMKKIPGTPVKRVKTSYLGGVFDGGRPWQSAVAAKVGGLGFDLDLQSGGGKGGKVPRKSLPAVFPWRGRSRGDGDGDGGGDTESEGEEDSPSFRREARYEGLGIGKPEAKPKDGGFPKSRWLMRRSSSGIFSSGSELSVGTPTKLQGKIFVQLRGTYWFLLFTLF
jgi:mitosis inhibitor protein kinase SWE1